MGPETGFAPTLRVTIYLRVSNQLPVFLVMVFIFHRYYGACVPSLLSIIHSFGFCILSSILGAQALASITDIGGT